LFRLISPLQRRPASKSGRRTQRRCHRGAARPRNSDRWRSESSSNLALRRASRGRTIVDRIHHVDALAACARKLHRLDVFLGRPQRIDARLLRLGDSRFRVGPVVNSGRQLARSSPKRFRSNSARSPAFSLIWVLSCIPQTRTAESAGGIHNRIEMSDFVH
jgi:hypothetical protein